MKKLFFVLSSFFIFSTVFAVDFSVKFENIDEDILPILESAFPAAVREAKKIGVNLIQTEDDVPSEMLSFSSIGSMSDEELLEMAEKEEAEEKAREERYRSMGFKRIDGDGPKTNRYRQEIENRKERAEKAAAFKYPFGKLRISEIEYGTEKETLSFEMEVYTNKDESKSYCFDILKKNFKISSATQLLLSTCKIYSEKSRIKKQPLVYLDYIDFTKYRGKSVTPTWLYWSTVAALDDYSMVVRDGDRAVVYSMAGEYKRDLMAGFDSSLDSQKKYYFAWSDGKNIKLSSPKTNKVFHFDSNFNKTVEIIENPSTSDAAVPYLDNNGDLWIYDATVQGNLQCAGKKGKSPKSVNFDSNSLGRCVIARDGRIWTTVTFEGACVVFAPDGKISDFICLDSKISSLEWVNDDSFFAFYDTDGKRFLKCFDFYGRLIYEQELPEVLRDAVIRDYRNGVYYFMRNSNSMNDAVVRMVEPEYSKKLPAFMTDLLKLNAEREKNPKDFSVLKKIAELYKSNGGNWVSYETLKNYLEKCPGDAQTSDQFLLAEVQFDKQSAKEHFEKAIALYDEYGEETAKGEYSETMKILERLKKRFPNDSEVVRMIADLKNSFGMESSAQRIPNLEVETVALNALFPAFMNVYASQPAGFVRVKNKAKSSIKNVSVSAFVRNYMDFAAKGSVLPELKSGEEAELEVSTILNDSVLNVNENSTVQMNFTLEWEEDGRIQKLSLTRPVTLYKKSAMNWKYTSMLSCFILPNDATVSAFKFDTVALSKKVVLSKNFTRAMNLANALGAIPLNYVPDPVAPATENVDNEYAIDTVRFPFETLGVRGGDCDDMTTLYCSLLESAGVPAALVTVPGHIFCAFELGSADENLLQDLTLQGYKFYAYNEKLYVPVETTLLTSGFAAAWKKASEEILGEVQEFIPIAEAREIFPPVNVSSEKKNISVSDDKVALLREKSNSELKNVFIESLEKRVLLTKDKTQLNTIAKIFNSFGETQKAKNALELAIKYDKNYSSAYKNLAQIYKNEGDSKKYNELLAQANKIKNPSASTGIALQQTSENANRAADVGEDDWNY
ncbi:tetratricopeptide repeat protein [Treponema zioleckii]|uniref:tetratricopeptide repeat protein n=1 Tax=Treponema zioleckii TaxID=331680 RepID=UPI00168BBF31|nr:hypothetical protein [Treponema zioleckii]